MAGRKRTMGQRLRAARRKSGLSIKSAAGCIGIRRQIKIATLLISACMQMGSILLSFLAGVYPSMRGMLVCPFLLLYLSIALNLHDVGRAP